MLEPAVTFLARLPVIDLYVEADAPRLIYRDRAYQNGDGFSGIAPPQPAWRAGQATRLIQRFGSPNPRIEREHDADRVRSRTGERLGLPRRVE